MPSCLTSPATWNLPLDTLLDRFALPNFTHRLPFPIAHLLGHRTHPDRPIGNVLTAISALLGAFIAILIIGALFMTPAISSHHPPLLLGSFRVASEKAGVLKMLRGRLEGEGGQGAEIDSTLWDSRSEESIRELVNKEQRGKKGQQPRAYTTLSSQLSDLTNPPITLALSLHSATTTVDKDRGQRKERDSEESSASQMTEKPQNQRHDIMWSLSAERAGMYSVGRRGKGRRIRIPGGVRSERLETSI
ncbi:MAG: hypothetical protein OHK93_002782 [Ramalina farinacea]|uniref:Uncharacterized protein n=1 Tax=Ramalina farinacea TaxID=258253 RepID=A0AA43QVC3_9LECA|nr:hypothetical protein [Ramalina farinacea]